MKQKFDILVVGAGVAGATFAASLAEAGYSIAMIDAALPIKEVASDQQFDDRVYAISPQNRQFLIKNGIWKNIPSARIAAIRQMQIQEGGKDSRGLNLDALEARADALAYIVENSYLQYAALEKVAAYPQIQQFIPRKIQSIVVRSNEVELTLDQGEVIQGKLLVGADGARSRVREAMQSKVHQHHYQQQAIVANFRCEKPHQDVAHQWFFPEGILAWLPLPGNHISMVWSVNKEKAEEILALPRPALSETVCKMGNYRLGELSILNTPLAFPLSLTHVSQWVSPRIALVGDAAHTVHPLAGLGLNLGLGDVAVLARLLQEKGSIDPGQYALLRQYERERREVTYRVQGVTHMLKLLFNNNHSILTPLRSLGLGMVNKMGVIKRQLIKAVVGGI